MEFSQIEMGVFYQQIVIKVTLKTKLMKLITNFLMQTVDSLVNVGDGVTTGGGV